MEQTVYLGSTTTDVVVYVQAINSSGTHVALVVNTTTTKLTLANGTDSSVTPTVASLGTGKAKITFSSVSNSTVSSGDSVAVKVNGTADGVAFSEYIIPVFIATASSGGGGTAPTEAEMYTYFTSSSREDSFKADVSGLATAASISALNDFDPTTQSVTAGNMRGTDNAFLAASAPTNFTALGINSSGHVSRVTLVDTTTTNTDQRGTDNALLASSAPTNFGSLGINVSGHVSRVTLVDTTTVNTDMVDVSSLSSQTSVDTIDANVDSIKAKTDQLAFTVANQVDANSLTGGTSPADIYTYFTDGTREDSFKADVTGVAADVWTYSTRTITSGGITQSEVADAVWNATLSSYNSAGTTGKALRQLKEGVISQDGEVNDASATSTTFISNLSQTTDGYYHDKVIVFVSGNLIGQARHIETYTGSTKSITVSQAFTSAPANGDEFLILATHEHSINEIQAGLATQTSVNTIDSNVDDIKVKTDQLTFTTPNKVDASATVQGGDATAANQTTIIGMLTGATVVVSQSSVKVGGSVEVRQGMDYSQFDGTEISFTGDTDDQWPDLTSATVTFTAVQGDTSISKTCTVTSPTGTQSFRLEFTASELSNTNAPLGHYRYYIIAVLSSGRKTALIEDGTFTVNQPY